MKKVIFIHLLNDYSGSPKVLSQVVASIKESGQEPILYTGRGGPGFLSAKTIKHKQYYYKRSENRYITLFNFILSQIILFFKLLKYINKDIVIYVNTMLPFGAGLAGYVMRKPVYYHVHEISLTPVVLKRFLRGVIQLTAQKVIYVSEAVRTFETFKNKKLYVIHNALPLNFRPNFRNIHHRTTDNKFKVLMIASLKGYKGVFEFVKIAKKLTRNSSIHFELILNAENDEIKTFFKVISIPPNITLNPKQSDVRPFYQNASLVLNLSKVDEWVETFGLTIIEALAFGVPVIAPPVGGPAELITNGVEGYLMSSNQIDEIAQKINELSQNERKWAVLSKNAHKRSMDFTEEKFFEKIRESIYG